MASLREFIKKRHERSSISLLQIAQDYQQQYPISLRTLIAPEQVILKPDREMSAGDVSGWTELGLLSNGWWSFRGHLHSDATIIGDDYVCAIWLDNVNTPIIAPEEGYIGPGENKNWEHWGHSPEIAKNWENLKNQNFKFSWKLKTDADMSWLKSFLWMGPMAAFAAAIWLLGSGKGSTNYGWGYNEEGKSAII